MPFIHITAWDPKALYPGQADIHVATVDPSQWSSGEVAAQLLQIADNPADVKALTYPTAGFEVPDEVYRRFVGAHSDEDDEDAAKEAEEKAAKEAKAKEEADAAAAKEAEEKAAKEAKAAEAKATKSGKAKGKE